MPKTNGKPWQPGQSGNPSGRPKGSKNKKPAKSECVELLESKAPELIEKVIAQALSGDMRAMAICIDRLYPSLKSRDQAVSLEGFRLGTLVEKGEIVLATLGEGKLTSSEATQLMQSINHQARLIETEELQQRISVLEQRNNMQTSDASPPYAYFQELLNNESHT